MTAASPRPAASAWSRLTRPSISPSAIAVTLIDGGSVTRSHALSVRRRDGRGILLPQLPLPAGLCDLEHHRGLDAGDAGDGLQLGLEEVEHLRLRQEHGLADHVVDAG